MGLHGCNELCNEPDPMGLNLHYAQRDLLRQEGWEDDRDKLLLNALRKRQLEDLEMIRYLEILLSDKGIEV